MRLPLTLACGEYDRTLPLRDGTVQPEGIDLNFIHVLPGELFRRQARNAEFEAAEFSTSTLMILHMQGDRRFVGIPVFPSRVFRHGFIFINARSGIRRPQDLIGKRVGASEYQQTAALWIRAILQHEYGVRPEQMEWYFGGLNTADYSERVPVELPANLKWQVIPRGKTLDGMLESGEIDAIASAEMPESIIRRSKKVRLLFPNYRQLEADYFRRTGFFPIMHTVVLRRDVYEKAPWVANSLFKAFVQAKEVGRQRLSAAGALYCMLPWIIHELNETRKVLGDDPFPYGFEQNRKILEAMAQYSLEQGLIKQPVNLEEVFAPETRGGTELFR